MKYSNQINENSNEFQKAFVKLLDDTKPQKFYAELIGTTVQNISNWVKGSSIPDSNMLVKIAKAFSVSTDYLLGLTKYSSNNMTVTEICEYTGLGEETIKHISTLKNSSEYYLLEVIDFIVQQNKNAYKNGVVQRNLLDLMWQYIFAKIEIPNISAIDFPTDLDDYENLINGEASDVFIYKIKEIGYARMGTTDTLKNIILMEIEDVLKSSVNPTIFSTNIEK